MSARKRSITIGGHRTSFTLEDAFYAELERLAAETGMTIAGMVGMIDAGRPPGTNLSSPIRLHILEQLQRARSRQTPL